MKVIKTAKYIKKAQQETVDLLARYIGDGYLSAAVEANNPAAYSERYWADYYDENYNENEGETVPLHNVPMDLAQKFLAQGTSDQWFSDGYEAAQAAIPYLKKEDERESFPDTPMGLEDDNPVPGIDF
jgi:hypothetical protein